MLLVSSNAHWLLRLALASVFLYHGLTKFPHLGDFSHMAEIPLALAISVALFETFGGLFIFVGAFSSDTITRLGGLLIIPIMIGAILKFHWGRWAFNPSDTHPMGGLEFQVTLLLLALYFVFAGNRAGEVATA